MLPILVVCFYEKWEKMGRKSIAFRFPGFPLAKKLFSKTYPSFLTVKEGSTSHLGLLPSGKKRKPLLLVALNRFAIWLADHQRSTPGDCAGWDRLAEGACGCKGYGCLLLESHEDRWKV